MNEKRFLIVGGHNNGGSAEGAVRYDEAQTLTNEEQEQARDNIGAGTSDFSGSYDDLTDKPTIPTVNDSTINIYQGSTLKGSFSLNQSSGQDINLDAGGGSQVQSDWNEADTTSPAYINNKPTIPAAPVQSDWNEADNTSLAYIVNKPSIPAAQVNSDWNSNSGVSQIINKPSLATVATSGNYSDLNGTPTLATVATSGDYDDLQNKPTIPAAQVNADWNAGSGVAQILNKPTLATVATTGSYNDLSDKPTVTQEQADWNQTDTTAVDYIKNKPNITPTPPISTEILTFTLQGGTIKTIEFYTVPNYFYVEDISGNSNTIEINKTYNLAPTVEVFTSTDKANWTSMGTTDTTKITATIPANGKLYVKATTNGWSYDENAYNKIHFTNRCNIGGNIMSLLYGDDFEHKTTFPLNSEGNFLNLFYDNNYLIGSENLILPATTLTTKCYKLMFTSCQYMTTTPRELPATTLTNSCYDSMFNNCRGITTAPALPATTLTYSCYNNMFRNCSGLTTAPALPATTLAENCYHGMFEGCTSLTTAPALPATTLANGCYTIMFWKCTSLTTAPALPATTLTQSCYDQMFLNCSSLNKVTIYADNISASNCLYNWLNGVAATGDFYNLGGITYPSGDSGIPSGWTEHTSL